MNIKNLLPLKKEKSIVPSKTEAVYPLREREDVLEEFWDNPLSLLSFDPFSNLPNTLLPRTDISEDKKEIKVTVDLHGMDQKDVEITIDKGALIIKAEKEDAEENKKKNYCRVEKTAYYRRVLLPDIVDEDKIEAGFKKGVLTITVPKKMSENNAVNRIKIKTK